MTILSFSVIIFFFSLLAGLVGALTGLGGGVVIIPVLVLLFHVNLYYAMGASLISVIATSSGTASAYLKEGYTNLRIGLFLETAAVIGALIGAIALAWVPKRLLTLLFCSILFLSAYLTIKRNETHENYTASHPWATRFNLNGTYPSHHTFKAYYVQGVPAALFIMGFAGMISGLLGIGSGALKVLAMDQALRLPYKVATTTSNFMIGITAAVSVGIYFAHGYIQPTLVFPVMLGVTLGAYLGAKLLTRLGTQTLRILFSICICLIAIQMLVKT